MTDRGLGTMHQDGFEEWRDAPSGHLLLSVDHKVTDAPTERVIGVGDEHYVVWLTKDDALWLREKLSLALLAASGIAARIGKRTERG